MSGEVLVHSREVLARRARTFHLASRLLPEVARDDAAVVYAFCRLVDDTADETRDAGAAGSALERLLGELRGELPARPIVAEFRSLAHRLDLPLRSAEELIAGVRSDLGEVRVPDDAALLRYCYRVASTVGLMMCAVLRVRSRAALPFAVDLGIAMQITNITRDVAEDARLGRVYLPLERLRAAGVDTDDLLAGRASREAVAGVVGDLVRLADTYYRSADRGMRYIPLRCRFAILVASRVYQAIGIRLRRRGFDALRGRAVVPAAEKVLRGAWAAAAAFTPAMLGLNPRSPHDSRLHYALTGMPGANEPPSFQLPASPS